MSSKASELPGLARFDTDGQPAGTPGSKLLDAEELASAGSILVIAPHPDDEILGCGGLIAEALGRRLPIHVLILTDGTGSHETIAPALLRSLRRTETITAIARLGGARDMVDFLDFADGALGADPMDLERAVTAVAGILRARKVGTVVAPWHADPHPDHMAASRIAAAACDAVHATPRQLHYAVWAWARPASERLPTRRLALDARRHVVRRAWALRAHRSQLGLLPDMGVGFVLPKRLRALAEQPMEYFFEVSAAAVAA